MSYRQSVATAEQLTIEAARVRNEASEILVANPLITPGPAHTDVEIMVATNEGSDSFDLRPDNHNSECMLDNLLRRGRRV